MNTKILLTVTMIVSGCASSPSSNFTDASPSTTLPTSNISSSPAKETENKAISKNTRQQATKSMITVHGNWPSLRVGMSIVQVERILGSLHRTVLGVAFSGSSPFGMLSGSQKPTKAVSLETYTCKDGGCSLLFCNGKLSKWALDDSLLNPTPEACQTQRKGGKDGARLNLVEGKDEVKLNLLIQ